MKNPVSELIRMNTNWNNAVKIKGEPMATDISKLEDEIIFLLTAKKKQSEKGGGAAALTKDYLERLNVMFLEGQISADAYKLVVALYTGKLPSSTLTPMYRSTSYC